MSPTKTISDLTPDPRNARKHGERNLGQLEKSLESFGPARSIVIDEDGRILAGNGLVEAAGNIGITKVTTVEADGNEIIAVVRRGLTEEQKLGLAIADNRASESSEWNPDVLREIAGEIDMTPWFTPDELEDICPSTDEEDAIDDDVPALPADPVTQRGQIFLLGAHRLMCGDATSETDMRQLLRDEPVDLVWTDPPYGVEYVGKTKDALTIQNDALAGNELAAFLRAAFTQCHAALKNGGGIYVANPDVYGHVFRQSFLDSGLMLKQILVWAKNAMVLGHQDYQWQHEPIIYGWKPGAAHKWFGDRKQTTILNFDKPARSAEHPTMKPIALVRYCLRNSSAPGSLVLDPFGGSGTTLVACEKMRRRCFTMELSPAYCDVILARWQAISGQKAQIEQV